MFDHLESFEDDVAAMLQDHHDWTWQQTSDFIGQISVQAIIVDDYQEYWAEGIGYDAASTFERLLNVQAA